MVQNSVDIFMWISLNDCGSNFFFFLFVFLGVQTVSFDDWKKIDSIEMSQGKLIGKPREKMVVISEILKLVNGSWWSAQNGGLF